VSIKLNINWSGDTLFYVDGYISLKW